MILSDKTLQAMLSAGTLTITPLIEDQIQPASVDIRLGNTFSVVEDSPSGIINMENEIHYKTGNRILLFYRRRKHDSILVLV